MIMKTWSQQHVLRLASITSIAVALIAVAGDEILQYSPQGYSSIAAVERALPFWRLLTGEMLGVLGIPLCLVGYWCVCQTLRLSNVKGTRVIFWLAAEALVLGVVSHAIVSSEFMVMQTGSTSALTTLANTLQYSAIIPGSLFLLGYLAVSICYFVAVIAGHTLYPRWMAFVNPFLLSLLIELLSVSNVLPVVGNVLAPAWLSIPHVIFFALSLPILWNFKVQENFEVLKERVVAS
jgi:hypothetical protein